MKKAILSVFDKRGLTEIGQGLVAVGYDLISTGGTAKALATVGLPVTEVAEVTGFPEMMDGRVKTLHPKIHGGILADRSKELHMTAMVEHGIEPIDIVVVNLYAFKAEIEKPGVTWADAIEKIDIGGPTMLRAAAKNHESVTVIVDPDDYPKVLAELQKNGEVGPEMRKHLAAKLFFHTARYDLEIARYMSDGRYDGFMGELIEACKYGENPWQTPAGLYSLDSGDPLALSNFKLVAGAASSYNNWCDFDRLLHTVSHLVAAFHGMATPYAAVGVKHGNACGASVGGDPATVLKEMLTGNLTDIYGGLIGVTFPIDEVLAELLLHHCEPSDKRLIDGIIAPSYTPGAIELLKRKNGKPLLENPALAAVTLDQAHRFRYGRGSFLKQPNYDHTLNLFDESVTRYGETSLDQECDLRVACAVGETSNSNTITIVKDRQLIGNGVGQKSRVACAELAVDIARKAGHDTRGAVAYSDAFFPFPDGPFALADAGISAILAPSGSVNDKVIIEACRARGVKLIMMKKRGFFGH